MPGSRIPIVAEEHIQEDRPDLVLLLPWNLTDELVRQLGHAREWNGRLVIAVPKLEILPW
jgi:hypothetical protein